MTMAEKVLARSSGRDVVRPGEYLTATVDRVMTHEAFTPCALRLIRMGVDRLFDPEKVLVILDHFFPAPNEQMARGHAIARDLVERFGITHFLGHAGICHQVLTERAHVLPGQLVFGTDSHSTTYGAVGAAGTGIGLTEMTYVLATGELWLQVPPTIRFRLDGGPSPGIMSKDVAVAASVLRGRKVHPGTRLIVTPASHQVHLDATKAGYCEVLLEAGAHITASGCGACPGGHNGVVAAGEVCLSSTNRNFRGRMGSPDAEVYLGSPASVAAAAVAGRIVDPREFWNESTLN